MKISNRKELQHIAINNSADISCYEFVRIYRECTRKPYSLLTIDTTLPASDPLRFRKNCFPLIKMTVTDELKFIDNKIKVNQAQHDLERFEAKISAYSSGDLRKHEYLTGEDLGYKPSVFEKAKFDYSPLSNIFTKGFNKDDQKERLFKRLENIKDKKGKLLNAFIAANKVSKAAQNESDFNYDCRCTFCRFYKSFEKFKRTVSIDSKHSELKEFYKLLSYFKNHKPTTNKIKHRKDRILNHFNQFYNKYFDTYKKNYDSENLNERVDKIFYRNQYKILGKKKQKSESTEEKLRESCKNH